MICSTIGLQVLRSGVCFLTFNCLFSTVPPPVQILLAPGSLHIAQGQHQPPRPLGFHTKTLGFNLTLGHICSCAERSRHISLQLVYCSNNTLGGWTVLNNIICKIAQSTRKSGSPPSIKAWQPMVGACKYAVYMKRHCTLCCIFYDREGCRCW